MTKRPFPPRAAWPWMLLCLTVGVGAGAAVGWWVAVSRALPAPPMASPPATAPAPPTAPAEAAAAVREASYRRGVAFAQEIPLGESLLESLRALRRLSDPGERRTAWQAFLERLPKERWPEMAQALKKSFDDQFFNSDSMGFFGGLELLGGFVQHLAKEDPATALRQAFEGEDANEFAQLVFNTWADQDLVAATDFFHALRQENEPLAVGGLASPLVRAMVKQNPAAAFDWIDTLPENQREDVTHEAFQVLSHVDAEEAARQLLQRKDLPGRIRIAGDIAQGWAQTEPEKALTWAKDLPADIRASALVNASRLLAEKDFAAALAYATSAPSDQAGELFQGLAGRTPSDQAAAVATQLTRLPEDAERAQAAQQVAGIWAQTDPEATSAWLTDLPAGATRDAAITGFTSHLADSDPEAAAEWAAVIGSPQTRLQQLHNSLRTWADADRPAARDWIQHSPRLTDEDRERLRPLILEP